MFRYCLVQYLDYEAQRQKKKKWLECKDCVLKDKCERRNHEKSIQELQNQEATASRE